MIINNDPPVRHPCTPSQSHPCGMWQSRRAHTGYTCEIKKKHDVCWGIRLEFKLHQMCDWLYNMLKWGRGGSSGGWLDNDIGALAERVLGNSQEWSQAISCCFREHRAQVYWTVHYCFYPFESNRMKSRKTPRGMCTMEGVWIRTQHI